MRFAIVGAGGVGGYYGGVLARDGHVVVLLARGAHLDALRERGLTVRTPEGTFLVPVDATDDPVAIGRVDYVLVAVKNYSLSEVMPAIRTLAEAGAVVVPLLNGVEVVDRLIGGGIPADRVLGGLTAISAVRVEPGVVERRSPFQRVVVGEVAGGVSERAERIAAAFRNTGVEATATADIAVEIWRKFAMIATVAAVCGMSRTPIGPLRETSPGRLLIERAVREVVAVARARGVAMPDGEEEGVLERINDIPAGMKPSLLLDLEAGGPTEVDDLSGAVSRLGGRAGVATPVHDTAAAVLAVARPSRPQAAG